MEENGDKQRELKRIRTKLTLFFKLSKNQKDYIMRKLNNA